MSIKKIKPTKKHISAILKVAEHFGGQSALARGLNLSQSSIHLWCVGKQIIPLEHATTIAMNTNMKFPVLFLRPDLEKMSKYF